MENAVQPEKTSRPLGFLGPDLVITDFYVDAVHITPTDSAVTYCWTIRNIGDASADLEGPSGIPEDNVSVQAYISHDTIFENLDDSPAGGTIVANSPAPTLAPGEEISGCFTSSVQAGIYPCDWEYIVLMVDWGLSLDETNETNNFASAPIECCPTFEIDIKPGSDVNPINVKSNGVIPVAIYGSADVDVTLIDVDSITFGPDGATEAHGQGHYGDLNLDGYSDLLLHFRTQETGIAEGDTEACLSGDYNEGGTCAISGCDDIRTVPVPDLAGP
jgi:hypothetical protein